MNHKKFFNGYQSRNANCNMFNQRNMFEYMNGYNGFTGTTPNSFMASDRDFTYARGRGLTTPNGGSARQTGGGNNNCSGKCGQYHGVGCDRKKGCVCSSTLNGTCVSVRTQPNGGVAPTQRQRKAQGQGGSIPTELTPYCGKGKCWTGSRCEPCVDVGSADAYAFGGTKRVFPEGRGNYFAGDITGVTYNPDGSVPIAGVTYNPDGSVLIDGVTYTPSTTPSRRRKKRQTGRDMSNGGFRLRQ